MTRRQNDSTGSSGTRTEVNSTKVNQKTSEQKASKKGSSKNGEKIAREKISETSRRTRNTSNRSTLETDQISGGGRETKEGNFQVSEDSGNVAGQPNHNSEERSHGRGKTYPDQTRLKILAQLRRCSLTPQEKLTRRNAFRILGGIWHNKNGRINL